LTVAETPESARGSGSTPAELVTGDNPAPNTVSSMPGAKCLGVGRAVGDGRDGGGLGSAHHEGDGDVEGLRNGVAGLHGDQAQVGAARKAGGVHGDPQGSGAGSGKRADGEPGGARHHGCGPLGGAAGEGKGHISGGAAEASATPQGNGLGAAAMAAGAADAADRVTLRVAVTVVPSSL